MEWLNDDAFTEVERNYAEWYMEESNHYGIGEFIAKLIAKLNEQEKIIEFLRGEVMRAWHCTNCKQTFNKDEKLCHLSFADFEVNVFLCYMCVGELITALQKYVKEK